MPASDKSLRRAMNSPPLSEYIVPICREEVLDECFESLESP